MQTTDFGHQFWRRSRPAAPGGARGACRRALPARRWRLAEQQRPARAQTGPPTDFGGIQVQAGSPALPALDVARHPHAAVQSGGSSLARGLLTASRVCAGGGGPCPGHIPTLESDCLPPHRRQDGPALPPASSATRPGNRSTGRWPHQQCVALAGEVTSSCSPPSRPAATAELRASGTSHALGTGWID